jgi:actin-like ATPase involved in cell morphogenesis
VHVAEEPLACVVVGSSHLLEEIDSYRDALSSG